jgi:2-polyprenyl-3-methyl-5-hydroxy-6-metoxy-1,4-benzoquinol methylase
VEKYSRLGWQAEGYDVDPDASRAATSRGVKVTVAPLLKDAGFAPGSFDAVTMWDSLEHVHDPKAHLHVASSLLKPSGRLWIGIPDLDSWPSRLFREHWHHVAAPIHVTYWSRRSLNKAADMLGMKIARTIVPRKTACTRPSLHNVSMPGIAKKALGIPLRVVDRVAKGGHLVVEMHH